MNDEARKEVLKRFCKRHKLMQATLPQGLADMICAASTPYLLMIECLHTVDKSNPSNGLLVTLIDRAYNTMAGALALITLGHLREAEILSRSVYESASTTTYIAKEAPSLRLAQFFRAYVKEERKQNQKWLREVNELPSGIQHDHRAKIDDKNLALDQYDEFIDCYIRESGVNPTDAVKWPSLIDRVAALGLRIEYRTVYAAMCSQAHHDAEDILNHFYANVLVGEQAESIAAQIEREVDTFSLFMVLFGLRHFIEAVMTVCSELGFPTAVDASRVSLKQITAELEHIESHRSLGMFPENWVAQQQ